MFNFKMSWFKQTLKRLNTLLQKLQTNPNKENFQEFHAEIKSRLNILDQEKENIKFIDHFSEKIQDKISSIEQEFKEMLFMSKEEDVKSLLKTKKITNNEIERYSQKIKSLSASIYEMDKALKKIDLGVRLLRENEKRLEIG